MHVQYVFLYFFVSLHWIQILWNKLLLLSIFHVGISSELVHTYVIFSLKKIRRWVTMTSVRPPFWLLNNVAVLCSIRSSSPLLALSISWTVDYESMICHSTPVEYISISSASVLLCLRSQCPDAHMIPVRLSQGLLLIIWGCEGKTCSLFNML